jgi:hypothetical protein
MGFPESPSSDISADVHYSLLYSDAPCAEW